MLRENGGTSIAEAERFYHKAAQAIEMKQYDYAIGLFKSALGLDPDFAKAWDGLKVARVKKFEPLSTSKRMLKGILCMIQAFFYEKLRKWEQAADKYEDLFAIVPPQAPILPHLGDAYRQMGLISQAIKTYQLVLTLDKDNLYTLKRLGDIYLELENMKEAKHYYEKFIVLKPDDVQISRELKNLDALLTIDKGKWEEETTFIEKTADKQKEREKAEELEMTEQKTGRATKKKEPLDITAEDIDIEASLKQAATYLDQNRIDDATNEYKKIIGIDSNNVRAHQALGEIYMRERFFEEAIKEYEKVVELDPTKQSLLNTLANLYIRKGEVNKAIEKYEQIISLDPENAATHRVLGDFYLKQGNKEKAISLYEKATELDPGNPTIHRLLGDIYLEKGELDKGITAYEKQSELEPDKPDIQEKLGDLYLQKENFEKAKEKYKKVLETNAGNENILKKLKEIDLKRFETIMRKCAEILKSQPDNSEVKERMEKARQDALNLKIQDCLERIQESPKNLTLRLELGKLYKEQGEVDKALAEFQASVNEPQVRRQSLYMLGVCFQERNMLDIAIKQFQKALAVNPGIMDDEAKEIHYQLGQLYEKMGKKELALSEYKKIYEVDIVYKDVARKIEAAYKTSPKEQS